MGRPKIERANIYKMLALGWDKKKIRKETGISERTYYYVLNEFQRLSEDEKRRLFEVAKEEFEERIFDKKYWFDRKTKQSKIPEIQKWYDVMTLRNVSETVKIKRILAFRRICLGYWNKIKLLNWRVQPKNFTEEHGVQFILACRKKGLNDYEYRMAIRNFLIYAKGIIPTKISGEKSEYGKMAKEYLTEEEIRRVFNQVETLPEHERIVLKTMLMFMLHTGTRIRATLRVRKQDFDVFKWNGSNLMQVTVIDKGRQGKKKKTKLIVPVLGKALKEFFEWRKRRNINSERIFTLGRTECMDYLIFKQKLKNIYRKAIPYREIRQPFHIWRHTFAMLYLRKTGWNYELVARLGGWDDTKTLRDCYGRPELEDLAGFLYSNLN